MSDFPFDIVLFDLDGTLVDSARDLAPAVNHALAAIGRAPVTESATRGMIGGGTRMMLERALDATGGQVDEQTYERLNDALLDHYWAHLSDNTVAFDGVHGALELLAARGCKLAVVTNKAEGPARQLLDALDLTPHFTAIYGGDTLGRARSKPKPDMLLAAIEDCGGGRAAMVGDSTYDMRSGRAAGLPVVAYRYGYHDVPVEELGADVVLDHFDQLVTALGDLRP